MTRIYFLNGITMIVRANLGIEIDLALVVAGGDLLRAQGIGQGLRLLT